MSGRRLRTASFAAAFFALPLYPALIELARTNVPGVTLLPPGAAWALVAAAVALAVGWLAALLAAEARPIPTAIPAAALPLAAALAAALGFAPRAGLLFIAVLACAVTWHVAIVRFAGEDGAIRTIVAAFLLSGAAASLAAVAMVLAKAPPALYTIGHGRATGTFVVPGELAGYLIVYVPVALAATRAPLRLRALAWLGTIAGCAALALTFSRAGWIGTAAAIAALVLMRRGGRGARYAAGIFAVALIAVALVFNSHHDPSENFTRLSIWEAALRTIVSFPFSGVGPFAFAGMYDVMRIPGGEPVALHAHSVLLTFAAETGLLGTAALAWGWCAFAADVRTRLRAPSPYAGVSLAIVAGLIGTWVQGTIDTVSVVIFGLWMPFTALALACSGEAFDLPQLFAPRTAARALRRAAIGAAAVAVAAACLALQLASSALYGTHGAPDSLPAHLPHDAGVRAYAAIERVAPVRFVEIALADDALRRGDARGAVRHANRLGPGAWRDEARARIAQLDGRESDAIALFLAAGDDRAIVPYVRRLADRGRLHDAYALSARIRDRLANDETRPNALAAAWWRLGRLARATHDDAEAQRDEERAIALAPLNTTYLDGAGELALRRGDGTRAVMLFARALAVDPADARAQRGLRAAGAVR